MKLCSILPVVYATECSKLTCSRFQSAYEHTNRAERAKIDRIRYIIEKRQSLTAAMLVKYCLKNLGYLDYEIVLSDSGKPYVKNNPVFFNISHSSDWVICALSDTEIGCDIEKIKTANLKIAEKYFHKNEYQNIIQQSGDYEKSELFYRYWTLKESFIKATGDGLTLPLSSFCIEIGNTITVRSPGIPQNYHFKELSGIAGYKCSVCSLSNCRSMKIKIIDTDTLLKNLV